MAAKEDIVRRIGTLFVLALAAGEIAAGAQNTTTRISVSSAGAEGNGESFEPAITADGRLIAFASRATNLVPGDTNGLIDVFVKDRVTGSIERVSVSGAEFQVTGGHSFQPSISADGRRVAFFSDATNVVSGDSNGNGDVFVRDRQAGTTVRVSVSSAGAQGSDDSRAPLISADGRYVVFDSDAPNLVPNDTNGERDVFRHDLETGVTIRLSVGPLQLNGLHVQANDGSFVTSISGNGQVVAFSSHATTLVGGDNNGAPDAFVRDLEGGVIGGRTTRISVGTGGVEGNGSSSFVRMSDDGRYLVFESTATNLVPNGAAGIYLHDRETAITSALSVSNDPARAITRPRISGDGRSVCFAQFLLTQQTIELFTVDRLTLAKTRLSVASDGTPGNGNSDHCAFSVDGTFVAFHSNSSNLIAGDTNGQADVFVRTMFATMGLDRTALRFGALTSGDTFASQTAAQTVRLTQAGLGNVTWTAVSNQPWLQVSPPFGSGSGTLTISVVASTALPPLGTVSGTISVLVTGAINPVPPIGVTLTLTPAGTSQGPFGTVDTPGDNRTGVTGATPFTGWALDDVEVMRVSVCRAAFGAEIPIADPNCGGAAEVFLGMAVSVEGARPDVLAAFPNYPLASRAGWGFMVLTNMLPAAGNGTYRFTMRAQDREGNWSVLGIRTMTCANASATLPFGTIDTPTQGGTASGAAFLNFGWALTPLPKSIPVDGSTIHVLVDGVDMGTVDYNHDRLDIRTLFPGLNNTNGAVGFRVLDTTLLSNGQHTISWIVTDNLGATEGLGSRFFTVSNGVGPATAAVTTASRLDLDALPREATPVVGRRGWDIEAPLGLFGPGANGVTVIRSEEVSRVELQLGDGDYAAYLRTPAGIAPLPVGSRLDPATNTFTWAPGVGFVGAYDLVFLRHESGAAVSRRDVRIVLQPKRSGAVGPQIVVDVPRPDANVRERFMVGGWAVDLDSAEGTGVTTLHAWAYPASGGAPIFLGATEYGGARPDVAAVHGERFKYSGFGLIAQGLPAGEYDLALFAWSTESAGFVTPTLVRVTVVR